MLANQAIRSIANVSKILCIRLPELRDRLHNQDSATLDSAARFREISPSHPRLRYNGGVGVVQTPAKTLFAQGANMTPHDTVYTEHQEKPCTKCGEVKPLSEFSINKSKKDGRSSRCKSCLREQAYERISKDREKHLENGRRWYAENREKHLERERQWQVANREKVCEATYRYRTAHPEKKRESKDRRRARKLGCAINDFTAVQWKEMQEMCGHLCCYCKKKFKGMLTQDHIIPLSKGGNHTLSNIIPACKSCNSKKRDREVLRPVQPFLLTVGSEARAA